MSQTGHEDEERRSLPARLIKGNGSERKSRACTESHDSRHDDVFYEVAGSAWTHCTRSWRSTRQFTTIKSNEMKPMNLQEEVKQLEEQESAINVACPIEDEAIWVITCKDDHEEESTQFDGETVKKMMINEISTLLITIDNVKSPEGFDLEVTRTVSRARMRFRTHCRAECCASSADS